ncbi:MAG: alpha/beta hydrolase [Rhodospirillales bacterium]|nr:alpha/beta hydrolase [Rhodospirillales bacterium]
MADPTDRKNKNPRDLMDPQMAAAMDRMAEIAADLGEMPDEPTLEQVRARMLSEKSFWNEAPLPVASTEDILIPGPGRDVPVRVYRSSAEPNLPAVIHFHGGGWVKGSPDSHDRIGRALARETGGVAFSVDYVLSPEHPFPEPLEDCIAATSAIADGAGELGIDIDRIALAGDSAGANLAISTAQDLREKRPGLIKALLLFYGVFGLDLDTESYLTFGGGEFGLSRDDMAGYWDAYLGKRENREDPMAVPMKANLTGLPPAHLCAAGLDVLRDDTLNLARRFEDSGVQIELKRYEGVCHAFIGLGRMVDAGNTAIANAAAFATRMFEKSKAT